jgi:hypothetical protein
MSYYELWAILNRWKTEFSSEDFARAFPSPNPRKTLHDMTKKGLLEHLGYGRYGVKSTEDYVRTSNNIEHGYEILKGAKLPYALTDVDGVFVWTKGGYNANLFFGFYPIHIKIRKKDLAGWKHYLRGFGKKTIPADEKPRKTLYGVFYALHPSNRIKSETVEGLEVEPLNEVVEFCKINIYTFEPALELLNEDYKLGLNVKYSER